MILIIDILLLGYYYKQNRLHKIDYMKRFKTKTLDVFKFSLLQQSIRCWIDNNISKINYKFNRKFQIRKKFKNTKCCIDKKFKHSLKWG